MASSFIFGILACAASSYASLTLIIRFWVRPLDHVRDEQAAALANLAAAVRDPARHNLDQALARADNLLAASLLARASSGRGAR